MHDGVLLNPLAPHFILFSPNIVYPLLQVTVYTSSNAIGSVDGDSIAWLIDGLEQVIAECKYGQLF